MLARKNVSITNKMPIIQEFVGPYQVTAIRDTGCSSVVHGKETVCERTSVHRNLCIYVHMLMAEKTVRKVPHVRIESDIPYYLLKTEAVCLADALYDLLIGKSEGAREPYDPA